MLFDVKMERNVPTTEIRTESGLASAGQGKSECRVQIRVVGSLQPDKITVTSNPCKLTSNEFTLVQSCPDFLILRGLMFFGPNKTMKEPQLPSVTCVNRCVRYIRVSRVWQGNSMAGGWSRDGAVQEQIDASVDDAVRQARSNLRTGISATHCDECEAEIAQRRREALPGVRLCISCQQTQDEKASNASTFNRRGSKDSQLR